jgi:hypothetical protein
MWQLAPLDSLTTPSKWCTPVIVYASLVVLALVRVFLLQDPEFQLMFRQPSNFRSRASIMLSIVLFAVVIAYGMLTACQNDGKWAAWVVLFVPFLWALLRRRE